MNIIYVNWKCYGSIDLVESMCRLGHSVDTVELTDAACVGIDDELIKTICRHIKLHKAQLVVSFNYYPTVSMACMKEGCRYFAWIYDSPYVKVYDATVENNVNYVGTFDSSMAEELNKKGVNTVHYGPLAVNTGRIKKEIARTQGMQAYANVAFVGSLYNDKNNFYERLFSASKDMELIGYLDALIEAQRKVYGCYLLDEAISDEMADRISDFMPYRLAEGSYATLKRVYADYYLGPRVAFLDRSELLKSMGRYFDIAHYSYTDYKLPGVMNKGKIDYYNEMPVVFNRTRINLNISLRSIRTGIPLRAMDIMGAGGFLLTNYQADMYRHFEQGRHFESYASIEEALDKTDYYIRHEEERSRIALAALDEMDRNHTFDVRLRQVFSECG